MCSNIFFKPHINKLLYPLKNLYEAESGVIKNKLLANRYFRGGLIDVAKKTVFPDAE